MKTQVTNQERLERAQTVELPPFSELLFKILEHPVSLINIFDYTISLFLKKVLFH